MTTALRILVAGNNGQVATALQARNDTARTALTRLGRSAMDISLKDSVDAAFAQTRPDIVINAAAYTGVDQAETEAEAAYGVNADGAKFLAEASAARNIPILHLSTDYVFDGSKPTAYAESDPVAPLGVYGASKHAGENAVSNANPNHIILRTAWVYSPYGKNFVKTMMRLADTRDELTVVSDQVGNPTSALDIADALLEIAHKISSDPKSLVPGIYHMAGQGETNWAGFASHVLTESHRLGGPSAKVTPIPSSEYKTPAKRPSNSRLDCTKLETTYDVRLPLWETSSRKCVEYLIETKGWKS